MSKVSSQAVCIVTGGSLGIGAAICQRFSQQGWQVINIDLRAPEQTDNNIKWQSCDIADSLQTSEVFASILQQYGRVDVLISNAGVHYSGTIEQTSEADFDNVFAINVKGAITATKAVLPMMKTQRKGVILYMASDQALIAKHNSFAYNMSKAALASLAKTTALDYASYQIRANAICPGTIETPLYHQAIDKYVSKSGADKRQVHAEEAAMQPLGRLGQADEIAAYTYFLASDEASFITGSLQVIDGGYTTQ
ncbi:SDR family oxidoreductase [Paraglaciecola sp.]|uniref:SDR family NAD(P)-dependent oxidoreductase n=1 Tax=Paraglaciecola sp. TaxID=1920173 RepID=UPI0030F3ADE3